MNNTQKIETGNPFPQCRNLGATKTLREMKVGDSVEIDKSGRVSWYTIATRLNMKITMRKTSCAKIRVWKVA